MTQQNNSLPHNKGRRDVTRLSSLVSVAAKGEAHELDDVTEGKSPETKPKSEETHPAGLAGISRVILF